MVVHPSGDGDEQKPERIQGFRHWFGPLSPRRLSAGKSRGFMPLRFPDHTPLSFGTAEGVIGPVFNATEGLRHPSATAQHPAPFNSIA
jgi:hypothetical protein